MLVWTISELSGLCERRQVVVLYDERTELPGLAMIDAGITRVLASAPDGVEIYREAMDNSRFDSPAYRNHLHDYLRAKYASKRIDVAVAVMGPALDFLLSHRATLFGESSEVPIVFCGIDRRTFGDRPLPPGVTGVLLKREFAPTLELALGLHPATERIVVVAGNSDFDTSLLKQAGEEFRRFENRLAFTYSTAKPLRELLAELSRLPPHTLVLYTSMFRDGANQPHVPHEVAERISAAANAPVYGFVDQYLGRGIVGGRLYSMGAHGEAAGELVLKILSGRPPADLSPIEPETSVTMFDWRQLERWKISENRLPLGSTILFREPTAWERHKWRIIGVVAVVFAQAGIIFILLANRIKRRRAERALQASEERYRAVIQSQTDLICRFLPDSTLTFVNDEYCRFFGRSRDELIGRLFLDLIPPQHRDYARAKLEALTREPYRTETEHEVIAADGSVRWQEWVNIAIRDERGRITEMQGVGHDITERKRAHLALRESEERFRMVADAAPVMVWMTDSNKLCTFINKGWLEFTGRTFEQELGSGWAEGIHPDDASACLRSYEEACEARREFTLEYRLRTRSGEHAWVLDTGTPRFVAGVFAGYVGSVTDISALKQAQERWRSIVEGAPNAMLAVDADGKIVLVNTRTEEVFGYTRAELVGSDVEMLLPETLRAKYPGHLQQFLANPTVRPMGAGQELFGRRKDGSQVPLEIGLNLIRTPEGQFVLASIVDITERLAAEAMLREGEKRMTLAADAAHLGMWVWDAPDTFMWTSAKWKAIHGYAPNEDIRFGALIERVHPDDRDAVERAVTNSFNDQSSFYLQHRIVLPDGTVRWISKNGRVERAANNERLRLLGVCIDITERKEVEAAAREVSGRLITAQEDERRRIARDLHDDLNQRLAMLSVETDLLGRMDNAPRAQIIINDIATRVKDLSSEVHKLSYQLHPAKLDQLGLVPASRSFCREVTRQYGVPIEFTHDPVPRDLDSDVALCLYRLIQEGLQNMLKHSRATRAHVELRMEEDELRLLVSDNGRGFDPRATNHNAGLGLLGMRERVRLVRGRIVLHSAPGEGTRIEVNVPLALNEPVS